MPPARRQFSFENHGITPKFMHIFFFNIFCYEDQGSFQILPFSHLAR